MLSRTRVCLLSVFLGLAASACVAATNLSGTWSSTELDSLDLQQDGNRVTAAQKSPAIEAVMGKDLFQGDLSGQVLKGRVVTVLPEKDKEICGKNWARWAEFELTLSPDGRRMEGQWLRFTQTTTQKGCPDSGSVWKPWVLTRTSEPMPDVPTGPGSKDFLIAGLALAALTLVFFFVRNAYVNALVGSYKRSPNNAGLAGWGLFGGLWFGSAIGSAALVGPSYLGWPVVAPLAALSLLCFVLCAVVSAKK